MRIISMVVSIILAAFSTAVMSYISMATPIGPWIAPTLVLCAMLLFGFSRAAHVSESIALVTASGSIGGILATACGFSFPTLYFLDPTLFNSWMAHPLFFITMMSTMALTAGWFGMWIANVIEHGCLVQEQLPFPVSQLVSKMISAQNQVRKAWELFIGFIGTTIFCILQDGIRSFGGIFPKELMLVPPFTFTIFRMPGLQLDLMPMLWAIGFVTGHVIAIPLAVGAVSKFLVVEPLNRLMFPTLTGIDFLLAFCSGMIIAGTISSFIESPKMLWKAITKAYKRMISSDGTARTTGLFISRNHYLELLFVCISTGSFLWYFDFSLLAQLYLLIFTFMCTHEIARQSGKIGLARLGMFATFVMVPALLLFNLTSVQIVIVATFVEICGGVAADVLFGRKLAQLSSISSARIKRYQYMGLIVSAACVGVVFWLLINHFTLGSSELFAQKAKNRQLLIDSQQFNYLVLLLGGLFGFILKKVRVNPSLVLGGLLMPLNISLGLIIGGLGASAVRKADDWYPLWSGIFAANSLWMLIKTLL